MDTAIKIIDVVLYAIIAWYLVQIVSRKKGQVRFKAKRLVVLLAVYLLTAWLLMQQQLPPLEVVAIAGFVGLGAAWLLVSPPKRDRRIPNAIRRQVIQRDLISKGLAWDPTKYHIDHIVPYSRGGDHSLKNLKVVERRTNLRKGKKMPRLLDFVNRG